METPGQASAAAGGRAAECAEEVVANVRTVRAFAAEAYEEERYTERLQAQAHGATWLGAGIGAFQGASNLCINASVLLVLHQGGAAVVAGELRPGELMTFLVATQQAQRSLQRLSVLFGSAVKASAAGGRLWEYHLRDL
jgi:ATP-binding cassette subfamily B (MDR/TAP) protein 8